MRLALTTSSGPHKQDRTVPLTEERFDLETWTECHLPCSELLGIAGGRQPAACFLWSLGLVFACPCSDKQPCVAEADKPVLVKGLIT